MEHEWGRNITTYGVGDCGATMCSRVLSGSFNQILTNSLTSGGLALVWELPSLVNPSYGLGTFIRLPGHPNFPYGYNVDPDAPL